MVVGFAETHGRAHTAEQLRGLEIVPRRRATYRGSCFEELDLDAILARRPERVVPAITEGRSNGRIGWPGSETHMTQLTQALRRRRDQRGITTAEYAVGTAAGAGLAGLLYKLLTGGFGDQLLTTLFDHVLGLLGIG